MQKYRKYARIIQSYNAEFLNQEASEEHLVNIARNIIGWRNKYYLLGLDIHEADDIRQGMNRDSPLGQR